MHFIVHAIDKPGALPKRLEVVDAHRAYLQTASTITILMSGPLTEDDGKTTKGSLFLIDAPSRTAIKAFFESAPLVKAEICDSVQISAFNLRVNSFAGGG